MMVKKITCSIILLLVALATGAAAFETKCEKCEFFHSYALGTDIGYRIFLPPDYDKDKEKRYPTVYLLHGYNFVRNSKDKEVPREGVSHWMEQENLAEVAGCLMTESTTDAVNKCLTAKGIPEPNDVVKALLAEYPNVKLPIPPMIIVTPDGRGSFYMDRLDKKPMFPPPDGPDFVGNLFKGATGMFETYISKDLVQYIDKTYRTIADREHRGIGGFSMGGVGSMLLALKHQDTYSAVTSLSASYNLEARFTNPFDYSYFKDTVPEMVSVMSPSDANGAPKKHDLAYVRKNDPSAIVKNLDKINIAIYLDAGEKDFFSGPRNFETFTKFDALLKQKGVESSPKVHVIAATDGNGNGMHTARYWRSRLGVILEFFANVFEKK